MAWWAAFGAWATVCQRLLWKNNRNEQNICVCVCVGVGGIKVKFYIVQFLSFVKYLLLASTDMKEKPLHLWLVWLCRRSVKLAQTLSSTCWSHEPIISYSNMNGCAVAVGTRPLGKHSVNTSLWLPPPSTHTNTLCFNTVPLTYFSCCHETYRVTTLTVSNEAKMELRPPHARKK